MHHVTHFVTKPLEWEDERGCDLWVQEELGCRKPRSLGCRPGWVRVEAPITDSDEKFVGLEFLHFGEGRGVEKDHGV